MYIPRSVLVVLMAIYLVFLFGVDWITWSSEGAWYRPYLLGLLVILVAAWAHHEQGADEL